MIFLFGNYGTFHQVCFGVKRNRWDSVTIDSRESALTQRISNLLCLFSVDDRSEDTLTDPDKLNRGLERSHDLFRTDSRGGDKEEDTSCTRWICYERPHKWPAGALRSLILAVGGGERLLRYEVGTALSWWAGCGATGSAPAR